MTHFGNYVESRSIGRGAFCWILGLLLIGGCGRGQARIEVPNFAPAQAATAAIGEFDKDGNGILDGAELASAPGLRAILASADTNRDGKLDSSEIEARLQSYKDDGVGMLGLDCIVLLNGKPLAGATVDFVPEDSLATVISPARAVTRGDGTGIVTQTDSKLPAIAPGMYRVTVSKKNGERETIPARYNAKTVLGFEVTQQGGGASARFELTSP